MSQLNAPCIDIDVRWGETPLESVELSPPRPYLVGDGSIAGNTVDFTLPGSVEIARLALVELEGESAVVRVPEGATAVRRRSRDPGSPRIEVVDERTVLLRDDVVEVLWHSLVFSIRRSERAPTCPRQKLGADRRGAAFFGASVLLGASLLSAVAFFTPPLGLTDDEDTERERRYLMLQYLDASAEREEKLTSGPSDTSANPGAPAAPHDAARGPAGAMGRPEVSVRNRRASGAAPGEIRPATARAEDLRMAQTFGMIGLLPSGMLGATVAPFADPGAGQSAAAGVLFGDELGESAGINGLALLGPGEGGDGLSDHVGLDRVGTCAGSLCTAGLSRYGSSVGRTGRQHVASAPRVQMAPPVTSGALPPDVIQRVVRQSFGRFRGCYEEGLRGNPSLEGRITTRFVIGRDGSVATVQPGGSDLPDARVVACVMRAYSGLSFPPPKDGIVTVSYPLVFSPAA